jgi:hypothetical protein
LIRITKRVGKTVNLTIVPIKKIKP